MLFQQTNFQNTIIFAWELTIIINCLIMQPLAIMKQIWTQMNGYLLEMNSKRCNGSFSGSKLPKKGIKSVCIFFKFHLVLRNVQEQHLHIYKHSKSSIDKQHLPLTFIGCKCIFIFEKISSLSRIDKHLHFWIILFQQTTFNNTICMRTHNQLHYYATIGHNETNLDINECFFFFFWKWAAKGVIGG